MRYQGRITQWKDEQGYGFITPNGGGESLFLHIKAFRKRQARPTGNEIVTYELAQDNRGRLRAEAVEYVMAAATWKKVNASRPSRWRQGLAALFLALLISATLLGKFPKHLLGLYAGASIAAFIAYLIDKWSAREGTWRIPENTLHLLSLAGGWPGALIAQQYLRHKTAKTSFQVVFWLSLLLNCSALALLLSPTGSRTLRMVLGAA